MPTMIQTKTKTVIAVGLTVLSVGALAAGIYYYGGRMLTSSPFSLFTSQPAAVTQNQPSATNLCSFTANPTSISLGQSSTLSWSCQPAYAEQIRFCTINYTPGASGGTGGFGVVGLSGSKTVQPLKTTVYTLYCLVNAGGGKYQTTPMGTATVNVGSTCIPGCTDKQCGDNGCGGSCGTCSSGQTCQDGKCVSSSLCSFTANPTSISLGQSSTLSWSCQPAYAEQIRFCTINFPGASGGTGGFGVVALSGSRAVQPSETTTYTLYCLVDAGGGKYSTTPMGTATVQIQ